MSALIFKSYLEAADETNFGTENASPSYNVIPCYSGTTPPIAATYAEYSMMTGAVNVNEKVLVSRFHKFTGFQTPLTAGGDSTDLDKLPHWDPIALMAGYEKTLTADTSVKYRMKDLLQKSYTVRAKSAGVYSAKSIGSVVNKFDIVLTPGNIPVLEFDTIGKYAKVGAYGTDTVNFTKIPRPLGVHGGNTSASVFGVNNLEVVNFTYTTNYTNVFEGDNINDNSARVASCAPMGTIEFVAVPITTLDWAARMEDGAPGIINIQHGTSGGSIVEVNHSLCSLSFTGEGDNAGRKTLQFDIQYTSDANDYHGEIITR